MPDDPRAASAIATLRARRDSFIRPLGSEQTMTLGTGNAVFPGGVWLVGPDGQRRSLRTPPALWIWPAIIGGTWVVFVGGIAIAGPPAWLMLVLAGAFTLLFGFIAIGAYLVMRDRAKRKLVIDAQRRTLEEVVDGRVTVSVPAEVVQAVRISRYENSDREVRYDVLVNVGFTELWIQQDDSPDDGAALGRCIADALGVPFDPATAAAR